MVRFDEPFEAALEPALEPEDWSEWWETEAGQFAMCFHTDCEYSLFTLRSMSDYVHDGMTLFQAMVQAVNDNHDTSHWTCRLGIYNKTQLAIINEDDNNSVTLLSAIDTARVVMNVSDDMDEWREMHEEE